MENEKNEIIDIKTYDFEKSRKFSARNLAFLETIADEYCKTSNLQLQHELKHEDLKFKTKSFSQETLSSMLEKTDYDTVLTDFSIGRANNMIIKFDKFCALTFVECLLGGDGTVYKDTRNITDIDIAILTYLNDILFSKLSFDSLYQASVTINDVYTNTAQFKTLLSTSENLFVYTMDVLLRDNLIGEISICVPSSSIEGIINELISKKEGDIQNYKLRNSENTNYENEMLNSLFENKVTFDVVAELGTTTITVGELLELDKDDVLILNRKINEPIDVLVGDSLAYKAQPGISGLNKAIVIEDLAEKGDKTNVR